MSIIKDNENWPLISKSSARKGFFAFGSNRKTILGPRVEEFDHPGQGYPI
jgi:hypothetical protein